MRISDWSSDVCSSDLHWVLHPGCERVAGSADIARLQQRVQPQDPECDPTASMANVDARGSAVSQPCSGDEFDNHVPVVEAERIASSLAFQRVKERSTGRNAPYFPRVTVERRGRNNNNTGRS